MGGINKEILKPCRYQVLYLVYGSKEKTNTGWKFLNNYINKKEKQGNKVKNQLYKFVAYIE